MKASRYNKVLGLAIGEKSILVAEVSSNVERPEARRLGEFVFPQGASLADPTALGQALGEFLREQKYSARHAVIGLPAKWLLVKTKEVPPADNSVVADLLRLQAEGDFSSELKDLVFDYAGQGSTAGPGNVLLIATQQKHLDMSRQLCDAAKLDVIAVTSSAVALGAVTGRAGAANAVVLTLTAGGSELTAQSGGHTSTLRHLRGPAPEALFLSELRRAVSMIPANGTNGGREIIVWDGNDLQAPGLGDSLGMRVRAGDLPSLGVTTTEAARNGGGRKFAAAVALGLSGLGDRSLPIDFLHSRLAPPKKQLVARWMIWAALGVAASILIGGIAYVRQGRLQKELNDLTAQNKRLQPDKDRASEFVAKVTMAQHWHGGDPRYVACMNEITRLVPDDGQTYCTSLDIREKEPTKSDSKKDAAKTGNEDQFLAVTLFAKAPSQAAALQLKDAFQRDRERFIDMNYKGALSTGTKGEVSVSFTCTYVPVKRVVP